MLARGNDGEPSLQRTADVSPRGAIVDIQGLRQAIAAKGIGQMAPHGGTLLVDACLQTHSIARVIVDHGQWMTTSPDGKGHVALEVRLPQLIGRLLAASRLHLSSLDPQRRLRPVASAYGAGRHLSCGVGRRRDLRCSLPGGLVLRPLWDSRALLPDDRMPFSIVGQAGARSTDEQEPELAGHELLDVWH